MLVGPLIPKHFVHKSKSIFVLIVLKIGGPDSDFEYSTQSYTGYEPTSMRGKNYELRERERETKKIILDYKVIKVVFLSFDFLCLFFRFCFILVSSCKFLAIRARYDPFVQTRNRVDQLKRLGHSTDKVEFILMGGTFMSLPSDYRDFFVRNLHDALSGYLNVHLYS